MPHTDAIDTVTQTNRGQLINLAAAASPSTVELVGASVTKINKPQHNRNHVTAIKAVVRYGTAAAAVEPSLDGTASAMPLSGRRSSSGQATKHICSISNIQIQQRHLITDVSQQVHQ